MSDIYSMDPEVAEVMEVFLGFLSIFAVVMVITLVFSIVCYVLRSSGMYTIAKRRGINHPWMAWVPVVDYYLTGCIADQYRYVAKGENKSRRKALLVLSIIFWVVYIAFMVLYSSFWVQLVRETINGFSNSAYMVDFFGTLLGVGGLSVVMSGLSIALLIVRYVAMYDVYNSLDPHNSVMFLVLSIIFPVTEPFFIFCNRKKDLGMPPKKETPVYQELPQQPAAEPWEQNNGE